MNTINFKFAQKKISNLWYLGSGLIFFLLLVQTFTGKYGDDLLEAWGWFSQNFVPTLSLISGVLVKQNQPNQPTMVADKYLFKMAFRISLFYLTCTLLTIFAQPVSFRLIDASAIEVLKNSNVFLGILQGINLSFIGVFYFTKDEDTANK